MHDGEIRVIIVVHANLLLVPSREVRESSERADDDLQAQASRAQAMPNARLSVLTPEPATVHNFVVRGLQATKHAACS
jgi:hypothetical protein